MGASAEVGRGRFRLSRQLRLLLGGDRERGGAAVEAALLTPVFLVLIFGLMEGSWILFGDHAIRGSAASGVRTASALANQVGDGTTAFPSADWAALQSAKNGIDTIGRSNLIRVVIYKANNYGDAPTTGCRGGTPQAGVCNVYDGSDLSKLPSAFGCTPGSSPDRHWCPSARKTAVSGPLSPPDFIGVWVEARHPSLSSIVFGADRYITTQSVLQVEPRTVE